MREEKRELHFDLEVHLFEGENAFLVWLEKHQKREVGIWLKLGKKNSGKETISYEQAREAAIRYGWIDGLINKYDEQYYLIRFTPRRPRSQWSKINRNIAEQLIRDGKMKSGGLLQIEAAKKDGRWERAYDSQSTMAIPCELQNELDKFPRAKKFFSAISSINRYAFLYRIQNAKQAETKARHIQKTIEMLLSGEVYHPQEPKPTTSKKPAKKASREK